MKKKFSPILLMTLLLLMSLPSICQLNPTNKRLIDSMTFQMNQIGMFNGVVLIAKKGQIEYQTAWGTTSTHSEKRLDITSSFNLASISKQFTASLIMLLQEKGKLAYDDWVKSYLPDFPYPNVTIRNLLNHTSGLEEYFDLADLYTNTLDTLDNFKVLSLLMDYHPPLRFDPGTQWEYSNTGYVLLGSIIEKVANQPYETFFNDQIAKPLDLKNTFVYYLNMKNQPDQRDQRVIGSKRIHGKFVDHDLMRYDGVIGDGNIYSSAADLLTWEQSLYGSKTVSKTSIAAAFTPVRLKDGTTHPYGFGWNINTHENIVSHAGSWVGFKNFIERDLNHNKTLIILTSSSNFSMGSMVKEVLAGQNPALPQTQLIKNITLIDGTGTPARNVDIRISGTQIYDIGELVPFNNEPIIEGNGLTLAPGFIDSHSHHFGSLSRDPSAIPMISQGITTIVIGQDGGSYAMDTLESFFKKQAVAVNVASYTGHATLREAIMGDHDLLRTSHTSEIKEMQEILSSEMSKGSLGLSTGLEYEAGFYSNFYEIISLAKIVAEHNGRYISHLRSEDIKLEEALEEIISIGKVANVPVQVSHLKIAKKDNWNQSSFYLNKLQKARNEGVNITADVYPYNFWNSTLRVLFPNRDYTNLSSAQFAVDQLFDPSESYLVQYAPIPEYTGKTVSAIARERNESTAQTLINLIAMATEFDKKNPEFTGSIEVIAAKSMSDQDVSDFLAWPYTNLCSDGAAGGHPRGYGAFTRFLGRYIREDKLMPLETALFKMTGMAAEHLGINDRGIIAEGNYADLVLFNPHTVIDQATIQNSTTPSIGIESVWINGQITYRNQSATGKLPGVLIKKK
jgi:N-acyl-D-amino-acid deacylase